MGPQLPGEAGTVGLVGEVLKECSVSENLTIFFYVNHLVCSIAWGLGAAKREQWAGIR